MEVAEFLQNQEADWLTKVNFALSSVIILSRWTSVMVCLFYVAWFW